MPIEFRCKQCQHLQQFDESQIGQEVYCRVCYIKLTVPAESTIKPVAESQLYTLNAQPWDGQDRQELISFPCDICHTNIGVRKEQVGEEIVCAECGKKIVVPKIIAEKAEARRKDKLDKANAIGSRGATYALHDGTTGQTRYVSKLVSNQIRFRCELCGTDLFATEEQVGTLVSCRDCETKTKVPSQSIKSETAPLPPTTFEGDTVYQIATSENTGPKVNFVPVVCRVCGTRMSAKESQIGLFKTCPDCGQQTEIKKVPKRRKPTTETTSADAYGVNKTDEKTPRPVRFFRSLSPAILRKRLNELESCQSLNRPPLPKRPLTERFFVPFGDPGTWLPLLVFVTVVPLGVLGLYWAASATDSGGSGRVGAYGFAIFTLFIGLLVFFAFVAAFSYFATFLVHLYDMTYGGMDEREFRGGLAPTDYFINGFWLFMFSCLATVPGYLLGNLSESETLLIVVMMRISYWIFFPLFFLSSLEVGSMFSILAKNIIVSFFRLPFAWFRFYLLSGMLFALSDIGLVIGLVAAVSLDSTGALFLLWITLFFFLFGIQSLFFFRLLGRLAWLIEETYRRNRELDEEQMMR